MANTALKVIQFGKETTWGTPVTATAKLMGLEDASLTILNEVVQSAGKGSMAPSTLTAQVAQSGEGSIEASMTYEDLLYLLHGIFGSVSPTGAGPYTWSYSAPGSSAPTPQAYTVEFGASGASYKLEGGLLATLTLGMEAGGVWKMETELVGEAVNTVTLASLSDRTVELVRAADTTLYVDTWGGTIGSTAVPATLISAELEVDTKRHTKTFAGAVTPGSYGDDQWEGTLTLGLEFNASAKAYVDALIGPAQVQRQIRLKATSGTSSVTVDFAGELMEEVELFEDRDGNITVELPWKGLYNSTLGNWLEAEVVNGVSALV